MHVFILGKCEFYPLLINLNSASKSSGDYKDNLRSKHVTAIVFSDVADNVVYIILLLNPPLNKSLNLIRKIRINLIKNSYMKPTRSLGNESSVRG